MTATMITNVNRCQICKSAWTYREYNSGPYGFYGDQSLGFMRVMESEVLCLVQMVLQSKVRDA